jgi:hypothetical protein
VPERFTGPAAARHSDSSLDYHVQHPTLSTFNAWLVPTPCNGRLPSRAAYEALFTNWKNADPDLPILKKAKAEFAKLQVN